eukprot:CAMPEP_0171505790 /NCGR_PEP_ID=MMETSP0958-20121227/12489_1 /TAXON_ID=87120 /ORGANISM="Aurantiochytrium limacinum, Strain ATCCMYA-1381" /LENGTH=72 /DNA_ID=CAMNT_0012042115 /DNA_START=91 /DNA_END=309 /DNA_ORIENTATION=+
MVSQGTEPDEEDDGETTGGGTPFEASALSVCEERRSTAAGDLRSSGTCLEVAPFWGFEAADGSDDGFGAPSW